MSGPDAALLDLFREETAERLDRIVEGLLAAEAGGAHAEQVDALFRDVHSIKGNAGMVGFDEARAIAHAMEDLLDRSRERGELALSLVEPLLQASDAIRRAVEGEHGVAAPAIARLSVHDEGPQTPREASVAGGAPVAGGASPTAGASANGDASTTGPAPAAAGGSLRVAAEKVDTLLDAVGEASLHHRRIEHLVGDDSRSAGNEALDEELDRGQRLLGDLQDAVLQMRTLPLASIAGRFPRAVRDLAVHEGKEVELVLEGTETQLDRTILDGISETISHLLSNAVVHGLEPAAEREQAGKPARGRVELRAEQRGGMVAIEVSDDGRGVRDEVLREASRRGSLVDVLAEAGFSTAERVTEAAGRGVGLDAVKTSVEALGGSLEVVSRPGSGTRATLLLPLTLALLRVLLVERDGYPFGIPLGSVIEALPVEHSTALGGRTVLELRGRSVALTDLAQSLGAAGAPLGPRAPAIVVAAGGERAALLVDGVLGEQEVVVKSLGLLAWVPGYLGAAVLGDGRVALVLDPAHVIRRAALGRSAPPAARNAPTLDAGTQNAAVPKGSGGVNGSVGANERPSANGGAAANGASRRSRVLVVDDQITVRELQRSILETAGYEVGTARDGREALDALTGDAVVDLVVTDLQMPNLDGIGLLEAIRADPERAELPVVVLTSMGDEADRRKGAQAGADAYLVKRDFDQRALLDTVARLIGE